MANNLRMIALGFAGLLLGAAVSAQQQGGDDEVYFPERLTAQELLAHCLSSSLTDRGRQQQRYCWGFVSGVEEALRLSSDPGTIAFCVPPVETSRRLAQAYIRYAGRRSTDLTRPAARTVIEALRVQYPCQ
jgi:hypothetical protein